MYYVQVVVIKSGSPKSGILVQTSRNNDKSYTNDAGIVELEIEEKPAEVTLYIDKKVVYNGSAYDLVKKDGYGGKFVHRLP